MSKKTYSKRFTKITFRNQKDFLAIAGSKQKRARDSQNYLGNEKIIKLFQDQNKNIL